MNKKSIVLSLLVLLLLTLACANPLTSPAQPPANVETIVAATLSALTAVPTDTSDILPHSLYYLDNDAAGLLQVYRLEKDAKTIAQVTFEPVDVEDYGVSPVDGSVAYVVNNQLFTVNADGSNRSMIVDGGAFDEVNPYVNSLRSPVWSNDGQTIAFSYKGLNFYSIVSGQYSLLIPNQLDDQGNGFIFPTELFFPEKFSPDGSKLLLTLGYYEGASAAIYYPNSGTLVRLQGENRGIICCDTTQWSADSSSIYSASPTFGMFAAGLWKVDATTGNVSTLLVGDFDTDPIQIADAPLLAPDGNLYFFYASQPNTGDMVNRPLLQLVRSAPDGVTNRTVLRPEIYDTMTEHLWSPDGSFVIITTISAPEAYIGGTPVLIYTDASKGSIGLGKFATNMQWGP
ncbi:MAG: PD40 domain-containing protein [Anaerolineales bacterium]|nr:PD40 domain-containing protein [Anaerolineales bacterium]